MAKLKDIDRHRDIRITPTVSRPIEDPVIQRLAYDMNNANLLNCDTPLPDRTISLTQNQVVRFLEWLAATPWGERLERDLQCIAETEAGEPLLTTWLDLREFQRMLWSASDLAALDEARQALLTWRGADVRRVYIDGFSLVD